MNHVTELTLDIAALEALPEIDSVELGGHGHGGGGCFISCVITCVITFLGL